MNDRGTFDTKKFTIIADSLHPLVWKQDAGDLTKVTVRFEDKSGELTVFYLEESVINYLTFDHSVVKLHVKLKEDDHERLFPLDPMGLKMTSSSWSRSFLFPRKEKKKKNAQSDEIQISTERVIGKYSISRPRSEEGQYDWLGENGWQHDRVWYEMIEAEKRKKKGLLSDVSPDTGEISTIKYLEPGISGSDGSSIACSNCGTTLTLPVNFCSHCGNKINRD